MTPDENPTSPVKLRRWQADDSIPEITALLHLAYAPLAAMGLRYTATHQGDEVTLSRLQRGTAFIGELHGGIVATVTIYPTAGPDSSCAWYREPGVHYFGQFAVHPDLQRHGLGARMIGLLEKEALARGARELALDTAEPAHHLRQWYEKLGYRFIEHADWSSTNYRSVILSKSLVP
ncbi:GNAT family N-acetyltransferase [Luteolibacter flavescens]|uniref:GNAT family N-acetyltransferase n=1 Tax=Luteolibacter flavescens TaxID=1859460 RepID=A0ABT3FU93_9BACT|nr:GNAT family N-acetyltransferase [Luteolibacter flavescens]MCW1887154.1 GNAT family N-acetyltransferase [Luteolibacter flavescens]